MHDRMGTCPLCGNSGDGVDEDATTTLYVGMYGPRYGQAGCNRCGLSVTARVVGEGREAKQGAIDEAVRRWNWLPRGAAYPLPYEAWRVTSAETT